MGGFRNGCFRRTWPDNRRSCKQGFWQPSVQLQSFGLRATDPQSFRSAGQVMPPDRLGAFTTVPPPGSSRSSKSSSNGTSRCDGCRSWWAARAGSHAADASPHNGRSLTQTSDDPCNHHLQQRENINRQTIEHRHLERCVLAARTHTLNKNGTRKAYITRCAKRSHDVHTAPSNSSKFVSRSDLEAAGRTGKAIRNTIIGVYLWKLWNEAISATKISTIKQIKYFK